MNLNKVIVLLIMENEKDKKKIEESMSEIKKTIQSEVSYSNQVSNINEKSDTEFLLLEKIVSSPYSAGRNKKPIEKEKKNRNK